MVTADTSRPTIVDVAREAGVSKSLVSLALRGDPGVSDATRARITDVAVALGYRSNRLARSLVQGRTALFGAVTTDLGNPYYTEILSGVEIAAETAGFDLLIGQGRRDSALLGARVGDMVGLGVDGIIVVSSRVDPAALAAAASRLPVVVVGKMPRSVSGVDTVTSDDRSGAFAATTHLLDLGHRAIAFASASTRPAALGRRAGYTAAMEGREGARQPLVVGASDLIELERRVREVLSTPEARPTAVVASNDLAAIAILDAAIDLGLDVPGELSIVGYDNTALASLVRPRLTSVDQPSDAIGRLCVEMIVERLDGRSSDRHEVLEPRLVVRASSGHAIAN
ncbi:LacI family DNA-binding transcriptional regulator [Marisediminicola sp. LYQ134]|uniref:LacI family DNA-binding transcriptional regulator n=1 Tax=unclassified Marisediminicola TaxID=2618316 RepID=UPI0039837C1C